jgi:hypothetical protein
MLLYPAALSGDESEVAALFAPDALQQLLAACPSPACESCVWAIAEVRGT